MGSMLIAAFYKFVSFPQFRDWQPRIFERGEQLGLRGTVLVAHEGVNSTLAGPPEGVRTFLDYLEHEVGLGPIERKYAETAEMPFRRWKVRLKKEIVTMGQPGIDPNQIVGTYVAPQEWNRLITDPEVVVVDTRNDYEVELGTFQRAINPNTESFRDFPEWVRENLDPAQHRKVAMFCTGGIRCEKATAYLKQQGFEEVYHLQGGILKYLEEVPAQNSTWEGECFVFDERVTVNHELEPGTYALCGGCRHPIDAGDQRSAYYEEGVSCPYCYEGLSEERRASRRERHRQMQLAKQRGYDHLGAKLPLPEA
ncbi:MAG: rhodanese-related sulfurtransferase [Verrucomicrobiota bacterium JB022]|nr:rhodanese-related sulfurtransferase [Verrucomicrobiota bacterium JB022]